VADPAPAQGELATRVCSLNTAFAGGCLDPALFLLLKTHRILQNHV